MNSISDFLTRNVHLQALVVGNKNFSAEIEVCNYI
jgi:hypothetical protein